MSVDAPFKFEDPTYIIKAVSSTGASPVAKGYTWPKSGPVDDRENWNPEHRCGGGLYGYTIEHLQKGTGGTYFDCPHGVSDKNRKNFLILEVERSEIVLDGTDKCKVPRCNVNHIASQKIGSRNFWRIIKSVRSSKKSVIPPLFNGPEVLTSSKDKAELFANLFSSNSTLDDTDHPIPEFLLRTDKFIENFDITPAKISSIIATLDISKATGPDGIPAILFQKCSPELSSVLSRLYNKCLSVG